jgi:GAF domain-containing protein
MTIVSPERLASIFVEVADTLVEDFDLVEFLQMLTERAADLVGAAAVGLLLADGRGRLEFMAGSTEDVKALELFQIQAHEGPCLEAFRRGRAVINANLSEATPKWPRFAPRATAIGYLSVHAFPLRLRTRVIGALNVFGDVKGGNFDETDVPIMQALADIAAIALMQERAIRRGEMLTEQLQGALNSRVVIEQAKGAIAQATGGTVDEAFVTIRGYARRHNRKISEVAQLIVADPATWARLSAAAPPEDPRPRR